MDERGGTAALFFRTKQVTFIQGEELLQVHKLKPESHTSRYYAGCCGSGLYGQRDDSYWMALMRDRFGADAPPVASNHFTKFSTQQPFEPGDLPSYEKIPPGLIWALVKAEIAGRFGR